jgi:hypothetical protein
LSALQHSGARLISSQRFAERLCARRFRQSKPLLTSRLLEGGVLTC